MLVPIFFGVCIYILAQWLNIFRNRKKNMMDIPGPTPLPLVGKFATKIGFQMLRHLNLSK